MLRERDIAEAQQGRCCWTLRSNQPVLCWLACGVFCLSSCCLRMHTYGTCMHTYIHTCIHRLLLCVGTLVVVEAESCMGTKTRQLVTHSPPLFLHGVRSTYDVSLFVIVRSSLISARLRLFPGVRSRVLASPPPVPAL
ncbi:hypothetical protein LX32DRAFT_415055 [Colletotrichum zoysiae]|uniref:Uncharacterized protein n=1 Tax=Colletotrichum zoysiae TaxID=1216348 RepID=A0AAD9HHB1_9PEZI|nr:hypothetical protein LX32DRAFT_415055 [Colletotrichum zoysiae]